MSAHPLHLEIQTHRGKPCGVIRSTFREDGKIKHTSHGRISGVPLDTLRLIQAAFRGDVILKDDPDVLCLLASKEYGASRTLLALADEIGLSGAIYSRREWTFKAVINRLSAIRIQRVKIANTEFDQVTQPEEDQQRILGLLGVKL